MEYTHLIDTSYDDPKILIFTYFDHIWDWFKSCSDETSSVIQGEDKELSETYLMFEDIGLEDEIILDDFIPLNKTIDDDFLNKLYPDGENNDKNEDLVMDNCEEGVNANVVVHSIFNHVIHHVTLGSWYVF